MKTVYLAAVLLLAGTVSCTPSTNKIIDLPEWIPDINLPEIIASIREVISQILEIFGNIDWENLSLEQILEILENKLPGIDWENINLEEFLERIIARIQEIIAGIDLPVVNTPIEGTAIDITNQPSVVQIETGIGSVWVQVCVGAIITNFHVLSSASCFSGRLYDVSRRRVRAGSSNRYTGGYINAVNTVINNEEISIVRLINSLPLTDSIQTTNIIAQGYVTPAGSSVETAGWGKTAQGRFLTSDRDLYQTVLTVVNRDSCAERWSRFREVTENHICAGRSETGGRDADLRDVGSPLFFSGILVGVQSFGKLIGNQVYPVGFINVASHTNWIVANAV